MESNEARLPRREILKALGAIPLAAFVPVLSAARTRHPLYFSCSEDNDLYRVASASGIACSRYKHPEETVSPSVAGRQQVARLDLVPPSLVTDKITLDVRGSVENNSDLNRDYTILLYPDHESSATLVYSKKSHVPAHTSVGINYRRSTSGWGGTA